MKKNALRLVGLLLSLITTFSLLSVLGPTSAFATEESTALPAEEVEQHAQKPIKTGASVPQSPFAGKTIGFSKYIYNLDDSADYIYVAFEDGGYAIFARDTMELMEYSLQGALPYSNSTAQEYYAGPANYLQKRDSKFVSMKTGQVIAISREEAVAFSQQTRSSIQSKTEYRSDFAFEKENLEGELNSFLNANTNTKNNSTGDDPPSIGATVIPAPMSLSATLIPNYRYFIVNPMQGVRIIDDTCGPIAAQLLLGYHNYYSDRRIIEDKYLYGYDDATETVVVPSMNPNWCDDPMTMTNHTIGTRSELTGTNSFYLKLVAAIMPENGSLSSRGKILTGIQNILSQKTRAVTLRHRPCVIS